MSRHHFSGNCYLVFKEYSVTEMVEMFNGKDKINIEYTDGDGNKQSVEINKDKYRMRNIIKHRKCVNCGRSGNVFRLEQHMNQRRDQKKEHCKPHINLYCRTKRNIVLMTSDHIIPVSEGGNNNSVNIQMMCSICNSMKDSRIEIKYFTPKLIEYVKRIRPILLDGINIY